MILNSIQLHNFMSYQDAHVDLEAITVACLAGSNGAGKSALLDAVTWSIWEKARSNSDELIRVGEKDMWVDVRFEHEKNRYRIRRARHKGKAGSRNSSKGSLDFQVRKNQVPGEEDWKSLTGASMKDTQKLINQLLRMDFDTFVNSAYLRQGRADEFTLRKATERKQVLAEILGLNYFDRLHEECKVRARDSKREGQIIQQQLLKLPELKAMQDEISERYLELQREKETVETKKNQWQNQVYDLEQRYQTGLLAKDKAASTEESITNLNHDIEFLERRLHELNEKLTNIDERILSQASVETAFKQYELLRNQVADLERRSIEDQDLRNKKAELRSALAQIRHGLEVDLGHAKDSLNQTRNQIEELIKATKNSERIESEYKVFCQLNEKESSLAKDQEHHAQLAKRANDLNWSISEQRSRLESDFDHSLKRVKEIEDLLKGTVSISSRKTALETRATEMDALESELELIEQKGSSARSKRDALLASIENLEKRQVEEQAKIDELHNHKNSSVCPLCASPIVDKAAVIARHQSAKMAAQKEIEEVKNKIDLLEEDLKKHRNEYRRIKQHLDERKELDSEIGQLREQTKALEKADKDLNDAKAVSAELNLRLEKEDYAQVERLSLISINKQMTELNFDPAFYTNLQAQLRAQRSIESAYYQLRRDLKELKKQEEELPNLEKRVEALETQLTEESYGQEVRLALVDLDKRIEELNYDKQRHKDGTERLIQLNSATEEFNQLKRALEEKPQLLKAKEECITQLQNKKDQYARERLVLEDCASRLTEQGNIEYELNAARVYLNKARDQYDLLCVDLAVAASKKLDLEGNLGELTKQENELGKKNQTTEDYEFLAEAFGKNGIQAIIIENAIPEIEAEANRMLSRLTDNQMHVKLETQQANKSGSISETLDILIGDAQGTRNYDLYSGGEAFKVNFAIRVALSRLLARRAGAKLETLIIDEGFGSQDELSREKLVQAIRSIQADFAKILVITHFSDVREMFPTHILVTKSGGTSNVQLV